MLARLEHRDGAVGVVDRAGSEHHRVDVVGGEELLVRRAPHAELGGSRRGHLGPGRSDGDEPHALERERVPGVHHPHPAEAGDSDPKLA